MEDKLSIIIPAAGLGRRMKSYGPKSLIDIGGQSVIERQISILSKLYPEAEIVLVLGFDAEKVYRVLPSNIRVVENEFYDETNVARSLCLGFMASSNTNRALIVYGDLVFNEKVFSMPLSESLIVIDNKNLIREHEVGVTVIDKYASQFSYGLPTKWAQIVYLTGKELSIFRSAVANKNYRKYYGFEILNIVLNSGGSLLAVEPENMRIAEIDTSRDIESAKAITKEKA